MFYGDADYYEIYEDEFLAEEEYFSELKENA